MGNTISELRKAEQRRIGGPVARALAIDTLVKIAVVADFPELALLLLVDKLHIGFVLSGKNFAKGLLLEIADAQGVIHVSTGTSIDDAGSCDLHLRE